MEYRLKAGDLGDIVPGPITSLRGLRLRTGGAELLQECLDHPEKWFRDPLIYRFGHRAPFTTIGCRELRSPSMHAVFYLQPDGSREAWIHFDLHQPHDLTGHSLEVIRNRLTLGHTSQADVYRSYLEHSDADSEDLPPKTYDYATNARLLYKKTFGPHYLTGAALTVIAVSNIHHSELWGQGTERYFNHFGGKVTRNAIQQSIEFGTAALLQQEQRFVPSTEDRVVRRVGSALYKSFFVPGHNGDELAFPRIAAAVGTSLLVEQWHPWMNRAPNPWLMAGVLLSKYVADSLWREFKPDIKYRLKKSQKLLKHD